MSEIIELIPGSQGPQLQEVEKTVPEHSPKLFKKKEKRNLYSLLLSNPIFKPFLFLFFLLFLSWPKYLAALRGEHKKKLLFVLNLWEVLLQTFLYIFWKRIYYK